MSRHIFVKWLKDSKVWLIHDELAHAGIATKSLSDALELARDKLGGEEGYIHYFGLGSQERTFHVRGADATLPRY